MDCASCGHPIDRVLPKPIPEGEPVMWSEAVVGEALYCQACFDQEEE